MSRIKECAYYLIVVTVVLSGCNVEERQQSEQHLSDNSTKKEEGRAVYTTYCTGCHGSDLSGISATSLIKQEWIYGRTPSLMFRNVKFGIDGTEMGGFEGILTDKQITNVVSYIRETQDVPPSQELAIPDIIETENYQISVEQLDTKEMKVPWAIEFVDNERALVSERDGQLKWLVNHKLDQNAVVGTPVPYLGTSTAGYMDIALDPNYDTNGWIYLAYSHSVDEYKNKETPATTRIIRGKIAEGKWLEQENLFLAPDSLWVVNGNRWGCRLLFDANGQLYFTIGDMGKAMDAQNPKEVSGKVFRINSDGSLPSDNPFLKTEHALGAIYSLGNRNVQGIDINPVTKEIWASEHGPMGGDELNIMKMGANYGWPIITYGRGYGGEIVSEKTHQDGMEQPVHQWTPSIGVCPIEFVESTRFPEWKNNLLTGALAFEELRRYVIEENRVVHNEMLLKGFGRVRDIKTAPDGSIYVVLNGPDRLLRLTVNI